MLWDGVLRETAEIGSSNLSAPSHHQLGGHGLDKCLERGVTEAVIGLADQTSIATNTE